MLRKTLIVLILFFTVPGWTQQNPPASGSEQGVVSKYGPRRQIATIVYMGLGGAVLGLSTLSFYGRPQDKLTNIPIGFGVGVIIGTVYMTYQAATNPQEFYRSENLEYKPNWNDQKLEVVTAAELFQPQEQPHMSYSWSF